jgi:hypothetical protein
MNQYLSQLDENKSSDDSGNHSLNFNRWQIGKRKNSHRLDSHLTKGKHLRNLKKKWVVKLLKLLKLRNLQ